MRKDKETSYFGFDRSLRYPDAPGSKAGGTSSLAADEMKGRVGTLRLKCLHLLRTRSLTADECASALHESVLAIRPRLSELRARNKITATGERRRNASGKLAEVWTALG